jgi:hypothetical protein
MKKNLFFFAMLVFLFLNSCRNPDEPQQIDQKIQLFIDSAGQDMLNAKINHSYTSYTFNDVYGSTDVVPVSMTLQKTTDTICYLEYLAGATRIPTDNNSPHQKYQSKIALAFKKKNGTTVVTTNDTLVLNYTMNPQVFQIDNAVYNGATVFQKTVGAGNSIKIFK